MTNANEAWRISAIQVTVCQTLLPIRFHIARKHECHAFSGVASLERAVTSQTGTRHMVLLDPPCSYDRRVPAFPRLDPAINGTVSCLRRCKLPPARGQPLNSDLRRARIRLVPVGVHDRYSRFRANLPFDFCVVRACIRSGRSAAARHHEISGLKSRI